MAGRYPDRGSKVLRIKVTIERFTDESQPGWVECRFADAAGNSHVFEEKVPIVSDEDLDAGSAYPRPGFIGCQVVATRVPSDGRKLIIVDTEQPWGIESKTGQTRFEVLDEQLIEFDQVQG
jgi:hypothetical protein